MKEEIWKDVPEYEGLYQVSDWGKVKSLKFQKERILKLTSDCNGYYHCSLWSNGNRKTFTVHILVAIAFLNHKPNGYNIVVDHINNLKIDNRLENLQLISHRENISKDRKGGSSRYVGVYWHKAANKWHAKIGVEGKQKHLGYFFNEIEAAQAYKYALNKQSKNYYKLS